MPRPLAHFAAPLLATALLSFVPTATPAQTFEKVTTPGHAVATLGGGPSGSFIGSSWVDTDGDGDLDLFIVRNGLFRNDGSGAFTHLPQAITRQGSATGNTWADVDADGDLDCYVAGGTPIGSALYRNLGGNQFEKVVTGVIADTLTNFGWAAAFADYDRDGLPDLVLAAPYGFNGVRGPNRLFRNLGGGNFGRVDTSTVATGIAFYTVPSWSDFDLDLDPDLFIGSGSGGGAGLPDNLYRNRSEAAANWFQRHLDPPLGTDLHDGQLYNWVDFDNDGDLDVYLTNFGSNSNNLYANLGGGTFVARTAAQVGPIVSDIAPSLASVWEDFDNDGDLDCYVTNAQTSAARFYRNDDGVFTVLSLGPLTSTGPHWGACAGDYDADGRVDLYVNGTAATHGLFRNTTESENHWLQVRVRGVISNRDGIGVRIRVRSATGGSDRWQMRELSSQNSFNGMSAMVAHFGLGVAALADSLVVEWPSGMVSVRTAVDADRVIEVVEPGATSVTASLVESEARSDHVRLVWSVPPGLESAIERRIAERGWEPHAVVTADARGRIQHIDRDVRQGDRHGYRLAIVRGSLVVHAGEVSVEVPLARPLALAIHGIRSDSNAAVRVEFGSLPGATVEAGLYDIGGRRVDRWRGVGGEARTIELGGSLASGWYVVRLRQGGHEVRGTIVVTR